MSFGSRDFKTNQKGRRINVYLIRRPFFFPSSTSRALQSEDYGHPRGHLTEEVREIARLAQEAIPTHPEGPETWDAGARASRRSPGCRLRGNAQQTGQLRSRAHIEDAGRVSVAEILLLGGDKSHTSGIGTLLRQDRHIVHLLRDVERWRDAASARDIELIVAAICPSNRISTTGNRWAEGFRPPILFVELDRSSPKAMPGDDRVVDQISFPFTAEDLLARVDALIRVGRAVRRLLADPLCDDNAAKPSVPPEGSFWHFAIRVSSLLNARVTGFARPQAPYVGVATRVAAWSDRRDAFVPGHAERVSAFAALIANGIGLSRDETTTTVRAARLHDIGKIALPIEILRQRSPLAADQRRLLQTHPERGAAILHSLNADASIVDAIRYHHVRFDAGGHDLKPTGNVPRSARVLAVADVYDAMTSSEVLPALPEDVALERMRGFRGGQLDPVCVDALFDAVMRRPAKTRVTRQPR